MPVDFKKSNGSISLKTAPEKIDFKPFPKSDFSLSKKEGVSFSPLNSTIQPQNSFSEMSPLMKGIDIISRPSYATRGAISQAIKTPQLPSEILSAAGRGFTGQERVSGNELMGQMGVSGVPLAGFATEVLTDPLLLGGGAGYKAIPKAIGILGQGVKKIPGLQSLLGATQKAVEPAVTTIKNLFITKSGIPELSEKIETYLSKRQFLKGKSFQFGIKIRNDIQDISRKNNIPISDVETRLVNAIEQPGLTNEIPEIQNLAIFSKKIFSDMLTDELKAGVPITTLSGGNRAIEYFPRIARSEAVRYLKQAKIGNAKVWNPQLANALQRKTGDFTLAEFNELVKANGLESLGGKSIEQFFLKSPAVATVIRGSRSAKAITSAEFLDDVGRSFGKTEAPEYFEELPTAITSLMPKLKGLKFDPDVAQEINRVTKSYFNPTEPINAVRVFDDVQNMWKRWTLAPFPKYHIRNMVGNIWNNYLAGVNPINYLKAQAIQFYRKFRGTNTAQEKAALTQLDFFKISPQNADGVIKNAEELTVLGQGWYGADIDTAVEKAFKGLSGPIGRAMSFGQTLENNARLAHYLDAITKGKSPVSAAMSVKKYLFDYGDLTDFERQVMKRVFPFYTWTRKNLPLQLQSLWEQPQKFAPISYELRDRNTGDLLKLKYARPDIYERLPLEIKRDADSVTYVPLEGIIPAADLAKMVRPQEIALELLSPYLRGPLELAFNKSLTFESEIQKYDNETQELLKMDIPVKVKYALTTFLPQARLLNEVNKITRKKIGAEPLTPGEAAIANTISSVYKFDLDDFEKRAIQVLRGKIDDLERYAYGAKYRERSAEFERIKMQIKEVKEIIKKVKE